MQHVVDQFRLFHANRDDVAGVRRHLLGVGFRIAVRANRPRDEHHVEIKGRLFRMLERIVLVGVHNPRSNGGEGNLAVAVQPAADVPAVFFRNGVHHLVHEVQILDELEDFADFGRREVFRRGCRHVRAVGHDEVHEVVSRPSAEAVHVDVAIAVGVLRQRLAVLTELFPSPFAAFDQFARVFEVRVLNHLQVERQRHGRGDHVFGVVGAQQLHCAAAGVDVGQHSVLALNHRVVSGQHVAQVGDIAVRRRRCRQRKVHHIHIHVRRARQNGGVDGFLRARVGQVDVLELDAPLFFNLLHLRELHFVRHRAGVIRVRVDRLIEGVPVEIIRRADGNDALGAFRARRDGRHAQHHRQCEQESSKLFHCVSNLLCCFFLNEPRGAGCYPTPPDD